jgi:NADPH:quinone reductase-like Zn-dependent oxidoreductase
MHGAEMYATVGSEDKRALLTEVYGIPEERIFDSRNASFAKGIHRVTRGRGVDVLLNSLSGELLVESWQCVAPFGRFLELGRKDILADADLPMRPFPRNVSFHLICLGGAWEYRPELSRALREKVAGLIADCRIRPPYPIHVYGAGEIEHALRYMQSGKNTGQIVVELRPSDQVVIKLG